jgi:hypothetical protein
VLLGLPQVKQLSVLIDTDQHGKISKQEWIDYMSMEFDALDTDHSGELDPTRRCVSSQLLPPVEK